VKQFPIEFILSIDLRSDLACCWIADKMDDESFESTTRHSFYRLFNNRLASIFQQDQTGFLTSWTQAASVVEGVHKSQRSKESSRGDHPIDRHEVSQFAEYLTKAALCVKAYSDKARELDTIQAQVEINFTRVTDLKSQLE